MTFPPKNIFPHRFNRRLFEITDNLLRFPFELIELLDYVQNQSVRRFMLATNQDPDNWVVEITCTVIGHDYKQVVVWLGRIF